MDVNDTVQTSSLGHTVLLDETLTCGEKPQEESD